MKLNFLGGCREVGKNCLQVETKGESILFDFGMNVQTYGTPIMPGKANYFFLTHSHLDHSGAGPILYQRHNPPAIMTPPTADLMRMLLMDSLKIMASEGRKSFNIENVRAQAKKTDCVSYGQTVETGSASVSVYDAGHIPGSASFLMETEGKKLLYTGDANSSDTRLLKRCETPKCDILVTECTYSYEDHPDRKGQENALKQSVKETLDNDGIALVPCFAVGRTQEMLMILSELKEKIYIDGMSKKATEIITDYPKYLRDARALKRAAGMAEAVESRERWRITKEPCIIVTSAGMLSGGPSAFYMKKLWKRSNCSVNLTGFQVPGTPGRGLAETGIYDNGRKQYKVKMKVNFHDFSSHMGKSGILEYIKAANPEKVYLIHGEHCEEFRDELRKQGFKAEAPESGQSFKE